MPPQGINRDSVADSGNLDRKGSNKKLNSSVIDRKSRDVGAQVPVAVSNSVVLALRKLKPYFLGI